MTNPEGQVRDIAEALGFEYEEDLMSEIHLHLIERADVTSIKILIKNEIFDKEEIYEVFKGYIYSHLSMEEGDYMINAIIVYANLEIQALLDHYKEEDTMNASLTTGKI